MKQKRYIVFFAMPKTGSYCLKRMLKKSKKKIHKNKKIIFIPHAYYPESKKKIKKYNFKHANIFCFVRNPFSRLVSAYNYIKKGGLKNKIDLNMKKIIDKYNNFNNFCYDISKITKSRYAIHFYPQNSWIYHDGKLKINYIGRYENFIEDYKKISDLLDFPFIWTDKKDSKALTSRKDYINYYNEKAKKIVMNFYEKDFDLFDYKKELI